MRLIFNFLLLFLLTFFAFSCKTDYEKMVEKELKSGIRNDSIFFGLYFGMTRDSFYKHCLVLNRSGMVTNGPENNSVLYVFQSFRCPIDMNFYPEFEKNTICKMGISFNYQCWAPWNRDYYAETMLTDARQIIEKWYGTGFLEVKKPKTNKSIWVKVAGNRQVMYYVKDDKSLRLEIQDLLAKPLE
jgi:hypothetical protein